MTSRERVMAALNHQEPDRVPIDLGGTVMSGIMAQALDRFLKSGGDNRKVRVNELFQMLGEVEMDLVDRWDLDVLPVEPLSFFFDIPRQDWKPWTLFDGTEVFVPGAFTVDIDDDGSWLLRKGGDPSQPVEARMPENGFYFDIPATSKFDMDWEPPSIEQERNDWKPPTDEELRFAADRAAHLRKHTDKALIFTSAGWWGLGLPGSIPEALTLLASDPAYVNDLLDMKVEVGLRNLEIAYTALGDSVDLMMIDGQDFGTQRAEMFSPRAFEELFAPRFAALAGWVHEHTPWKVWQHSCGSIPNLIPQLVEAGIDALNPVQTTAEGMDAAFLKSEFGDRLTFWGGGVDTQRTLPFGTPEEVFEEVRERIQVFAPGGGFVFAAVHNIQASTPPENIEAMLESVRHHGTYPIV
jgi:hypothetical protein